MMFFVLIMLFQNSSTNFQPKCNGEHANLLDKMPINFNINDKLWTIIMI
jgi:hypothetical protein